MSQDPAGFSRVKFKAMRGSYGDEIGLGSRDFKPNASSLGNLPNFNAVFKVRLELFRGIREQG